MPRKRYARRNTKRKRRGRLTRKGHKVQSKLLHAMNKLKNMGASRRVEEVVAAPNKLIRDMSTALRKAREQRVTWPKGLAKQVQRYRKTLKTLSNPHVTINKKRKLIRQKGGGLLGTIAKLIPTVASLIGILPI